MNTAQTQVKLNISVSMKEFLESKASKFGMPIVGYIKHLILKEIEDMDYPIYQASDETEKVYKKAIEEYDSGKTIKINDIDSFFDELKHCMDFSFSTEVTHELKPIKQKQPLVFKNYNSN